MKFDKRKNHSGDALNDFLFWLENETTSCLNRSHGNGEMVKACMFLYTNRANEAHLDEELIYQIIGKCIGRAGYSEQEESYAFDMFEPLHSLALQVHDNA